MKLTIKTENNTYYINEMGNVTKEDLNTSKRVSNFERSNKYKETIKEIRVIKNEISIMFSNKRFYNENEIQENIYYSLNKLNNLKTNKLGQRYKILK